MNYDEVVKYVQENKTRGVKKYRITMNDGTKIEKRLFISSGGYLAYFRRGSSRYGYAEYTYPNWVKLQAIMPRYNDPVHVMRSNLKKLIAYTDASGLWPDLNKDWKDMAKLGDDELKELHDATYGAFEKLREKYNLSGGYDSFAGLSLPRLVKTVNFDAWSRDDDKEFLKECISRHVNATEDQPTSHLRWHKGYDNSVEVHGKRAWYSEEYTGCGNGHYYLLMDECHAMFYEND